MIDLRRAGTRFHTTIGWLDSWHSFSFGQHHDPRNVNHGLLLVNNDDRVAPASGFGTHGHRDMEIVTWVLDGAVEHKDSAGNHAVIRRDVAQRMSAGTGIRHSEWNPSPDDEVHFLQMWVLPDREGVEPGYQEADVRELMAAGGLVKIASGTGDAAIHIHQRDAALYVARLAPGASVDVPGAPHVHVFVARGGATIDDHDGASLDEGDALRLANEDGLRLTASSDAEVVIWATA